MTRARPAIRLLFALLAVGLDAPSPVAAEEPVDRIVALVGGDIILASELETRARLALAELQRAGQSAAELTATKRDQILAETLDKLVDERLLMREATTMRLAVTTDEVDRAVANIARENGIDLDTLRRAVIGQGMDWNAYQANMRREILRFKVLNLRVRGRVKVTEAEARQYYNDQVRGIRATGRYEGAHLLVRVADGATASEVQAVRRRAEALLKRIAAGEDFTSLARELSEDQATAPQGGRLGERGPGELPRLLERAFVDLEPGELGGPIRSPAGFHLLKLLSREELGVQPFAEVKDRIVAQLAQEEMARQERMWLKELRLRTFIEVRR